MRKTIIKLIAWGLSLMCVLGSVCSCESLFGKNKETEQGTQSTDESSVSNCVIVRTRDCGTDRLNLCYRLTDVLVAQGMNVSLEKEGNVEFSTDKDTIYILIGETSEALSKNNQDRVTEGFASFLMEENRLSICASDDRVLWLAVEHMVQDCTTDGAFELIDKYHDAKVDYAEQSRKGWTLTCPAYFDGTLDESVYSCGYGFEQSGFLSNMQVINDTNAQEFEKWKALLASNGYREVFSNSIEEDLYVSYQGALGTIYYAYYLHDLSKVRIVCDTESVALDEFCYTLESDDHPEFYMLKDNDVNYGDLFLIHASDDSWIVIDGAPSSEDDVFGDQIFEFMKKRSAMPDGKLVISAWYISHAHSDHFPGFEWTLRRHTDEIELQRVMVNIPDPKISAITGIAHLDNERQNREFKVMADWVSSAYPNAQVLKVHTGMEIQLADISFTILYTQEDLLEKWYAGDAEWDLTNFNMTSFISMIEMDGMRILQLADNFRPDINLAIYDMETTLACDILKVGHHYIDSQADSFYKELYDTCEFQYALITMSYFSKEGTYMQEKLGDRFLITQNNEWTGLFFNGNEIECHRYQN